jgi:hypothetical protein
MYAHQRDHQCDSRLWIASTGSFIEQLQVGEVERRLKKERQAYLSLMLKTAQTKSTPKLWEIPAGLTIAEGEFVKVEAETGNFSLKMGGAAQMANKGRKSSSAPLAPSGLGVCT